MAPKPVSKQIGSFENEETTDEEQEAESSAESDESEPELTTEYLAPNRSRRSNAGNKMAALLNTSHANAADEFYESAYGGFNEDDVDENFTSPPNSDVEEDEVDSDFDQPEEEDEHMSEGEEKEPVKKRIDKHKEFERNRRSNLARNKMVSENVCDAKTQQSRLKEAKQTEIVNTESLKKYHEIELERKKRQIKPIQRRGLNGPIIRIIENSTSKTLILPSLVVWKKPQRREFRVCAVTGRPARYVDPLTELPYADSKAFKMIRNSYDEFLKSEQTKGNSTTMVL